LDVPRRQRRRRTAGGRGSRGRALALSVGAEGVHQPLVARQRVQPADLIGEDEGLTVLGEGDEPYRPHRVPPPTPNTGSPDTVRGRCPPGGEATPTRPPPGRSALLSGLTQSEIEPVRGPSL